MSNYWQQQTQAGHSVKAASRRSG